MSFEVHSREATLRRHKVAKAESRRQKGIVTVVAVAFAIVLAVGGTIAFLIDSSDRVTNTFTAATSKVEIDEVFDGRTKQSVILRNRGTAPVYVRVNVLITWKNADGDTLAQMPQEGIDYTTWEANDGWVLHEDGYYYWSEELAVDGATEDLIGPENRQPLPITVIGEAPEPGYFLSVEILADAVQSEGGFNVTGAARSETYVSAVQDAWGVSIADGSVTTYQGLKA